MTFHAAIDQAKLGYTSQDDRQLVETSIGGVGVIDIGDLLVSAGSGMNSSIAAGRATIRNTFLPTQGGLYLTRNDAPIAKAHQTADTANPRVDQVLVKVYDSTDGGDASDITDAVVVEGTANAGGSASTMLDSRAGVGSLAAFNNYILVADVYVPANAASAAAFTYRDRRPIATANVIPAIGSTPGVTMEAHPSLTPGLYTLTTPYTNYQFVYSAYLPRRAIASNKLRWSYTQGATAMTGNYNIGIYDASGRNIVSTGAQALTGAANTTQNRAEAITTTTFEAGLYYVCAGWASLATGTILYLGSLPGTASPPIFGTTGFSNSGGTTLPTTVLAALNSIWNQGAPLISLTTA